MMWIFKNALFKSVLQLALILTVVVVHFHVCVVDGVFEEVALGADTDADTKPQAVTDAQSSPSKVIFHAASAIDEAAVAQVQATLRRRILRAFVGRGLLESFEAKDMLAYRHSGFSVDTSVRIEAHDRAGLERLLPTANSPLRATVTALALPAPAQPTTDQAEPAITGVDALGAAALGKAPSTTPKPAPPKRSQAHYLWAVLIARIYEVFPLLCPQCGGQMRIQ